MVMEGEEGRTENHWQGWTDGFFHGRCNDNGDFLPKGRAAPQPDSPHADVPQLEAVPGPLEGVLEGALEAEASHPVSQDAAAIATEPQAESGQIQAPRGTRMT
jgi:hypothetical protein